MTRPTPITIDIISDLVCPWCYIGKKRLEIALRSVAATIQPEIRWHPFQLDPNIPRGGKDRKLYLAEKFGSQERVHEIHRSIVQAGKSVGIDFDFEAIESSPNTLDAHRVMHWAGQIGSGVQHSLAGLLFSAYFEEGADIEDPLVLAAAASSAGMDSRGVARRLQGGESQAEVEDEIYSARQMGVTGVPFFVIGRRYAVTGAQEPKTLAEVIMATSTENI